MNKPPRIARWILSVTNRKSNREIVLGDFEEFYDEIYSERGALIAYIWFYLQAFKSIPRFLSTSIYWGYTMFNNYLKIAFRNIKKYKGYSTINIIGLAVGLACCMFIILYVQFEMSYDNFHPDSDRIYRIPLISKASAGEETEPANTMALAPFLKDNYPQVEDAARIEQGSRGFIKYEDKIFEEFGVRYVDPEIFNIFSIHFIQGNSSIALNKPNTCVLTEETARKYFGSVNPIGEAIRIDTANYQITGIIEDAPKNTHFQYNMLLSFSSLKDHFYMRNDYNNCITYVKLKQGENPDEFESLIRDISNDLMKSDNDEGNDVIYSNFLQPVRDIHLYSNLSWEMETPGNPTYIMIYSLIGLMILLIACMNFINLTTAKSAGRTREVGLRKVIGAKKNQLVKQFMGESALITLIASFLSFAIVFLTIQYFNDLTDKEFVFNDLFRIEILIGSVFLVIITSILGGFYPALVLSGYSPIRIFR
ncbi:ABC transporter permease, partial [Bacteroidota bacterium]